MNEVEQAKSSGAPAAQAPLRLRDLLAQHRRPLLVGSLLLLATNVVDKSIPWALRYAVDALQTGDLPRVLRFVGLVVALATVLWVVRTGSRVVVFGIGRRIEHRVRRLLLERIHDLADGQAWRFRTGDLISRATQDLGQVRMLVGFALLNVINAFFAYAAAATLMGSIAPSLTVVALLPLLGLFLATQLFARALYRRSLDAQQAMSRITDEVQQTVRGARFIRASGFGDLAIERFAAVNEAGVAAQIRLVVLRGVMWPVLLAFGSAASFLTLWRGTQLIAAGEITVGQLAAFLAYLAQLVPPTLALGYVISVAQRGRASWQRIAEVLGPRSELLARETQLAADATAGQAKAAATAVASGASAGDTETPVLELRRLSFDYNGQRILHEVNLRLSPREFVLVVGATASGKTSLARLVMQLLTPPRGAVMLGGWDLREMDRAVARRRMTYVLQQPFLFSVSVRDNILFGSSGVHAGSVGRLSPQEALHRVAMMDEVQRFDAGLETRVGERGVSLSGGQRQRLALARALVRPTELLLLDEPLSAVDARTEASIVQRWLDDRHERPQAVLWLSHRTTLAPFADRVVVLSDGKLCAQGSHASLLQECDVYRRLARRSAVERSYDVTRYAR